MNPSSLDDYQQWRWLWNPFFPTMTGLYLVRYPGDLLQMTRLLYEHLMKLRFQSLIQDWMSQTEAGQQETHQLLCQALYSLEPMQEPPKLAEDLWIWREAWADAMIEFNVTFFEKLGMQMDRNFPFQMHPPIPSEQEQLRARGEEMDLHQWLIELTEGRF